MAKQTFTTGQVLTAAQMTSLQQTAMGGGSTTAKTANYVLTAADAGTVVQMNAAGATTITVNTALFAAGDTVQIQNIGAGVCTVTAGTATVSTAGSLALSQYEGGQLYFNSTSAAIFFDLVQSATGGGKVLQVIMGTTSTVASNSTTTYENTNLTATITPSSATSQVLVLVSQCGVVRSSGNANNALLLQLQRAGSSIAQISNEGMQTDTALRQGDFTYNINYLDSPATTSATIYKTQFKNKQASAAIQVQAASELSTIILMEIGA
jgi:hypothetical protein